MRFPFLCVALAAVSFLACADDGDTGENTTSSSSTTSSTSSASGGAGGGSSTGGGGSGGNGGGASGLLPAFVAQGHVGRTTISCDDGQSWVAERSDDDQLVCWVPPDNLPDCDHTDGAGRGVAVGNGWAVATFGWGMPGGLRRSNDGVTWENVTNDTVFGGVAFGNGVFVAAAETPRRSSDDGATWTMLGPVGLGVNIRRFAFVPHDGGRFIMVGDNAMVAISSDNGDSWQVSSMPAGCGANIQTSGGIAAGNGSMLVLGGNGLACSSSDGTTWNTTLVNDPVRSQLVFNGSSFMAWSGGNNFSSSDGVTWAQTPMNQNVDIGVAAFGTMNGNGVYVGVRGGWQNWYGEQAFYRSADGIDWDVLPSGNYVGSHPLRAMAFGELSASAACPSP